MSRCKYMWLRSDDQNKINDRHPLPTDSDQIGSNI